MVVDGIEYKPGKDGRFRCPYKCHDTAYPAPKWKTEAGFAKHLAKCPENPHSGSVWTPPPEAPREKIMDCPDCGNTIVEGDTIWQMSGRAVCFECRPEYQSRGLGFMDFAGLILPGMALEG